MQTTRPIQCAVSTRPRAKIDPLRFGAVLAALAVALATCSAAAQPSALNTPTTRVTPANNPSSASPASGAATLPTRAAIDAISIQEIARIDGQGEVVLRGLGIVTGLKGTGDSGQDLAVARPLAKIYESNGNPLGDLKELGKSKAAALVMVTCTIPKQGARVQDKVDVHVTVLYSATSLAGGRLFLAPLQGPLPGQGVFAFAEGAIMLEDRAVSTVGVVRGGAQIAHDILMPIGSNRFKLVIEPHLRSFAVADRVAAAVNARFQDASLVAEGEAVPAPIARALDDTMVEVTVPPENRAEPAGFIADCLTATLDPSELRLPAKVVINARTGTIIVTGNVEISPVAISHRDLIVTSITPAPTPTPQSPLVKNSRWTSAGTTNRASDRTRIQDLLQAFRQLDVSVDDQIDILTQMHHTGHLHAQLIIE